MSGALLDRLRAHGGRVAVVDERGEADYHELLTASERVARALLAATPATAAPVAAGASPIAGLGGARVAFMVSPGRAYVTTLLGIWRAGGIGVPLCLGHPRPELEYVLDDTGAALMVADGTHEDRLRPLAEARSAPFVAADSLAADGPGADTPGAGPPAAGQSVAGSPPGPLTAPLPGPLPDVDPSRGALILYTSGTTSRPKGVVVTHSNLEAQIATLVEAWGWRADDRILHFLPLHHVHGIVNKLLCALWAGATCEMLPAFDAAVVWRRIAGGGPTVFMAVPTIYVKLIAEWEAADADGRVAMSDGCRGLRLMVSGSAALPVGTFDRWRGISGHALLERYGMTEIGMALSNPLHGERRPGTVGHPLPRVELRLVDERGDDVVEEGEPGEIHVRGPMVFREYWRRPDATRDAFRDGWFRTGDIAVVEDGYHRILGRNSVDIIKTGGYKVSALEIEEVLRAHPDVLDCAVVGVADEEWGERVCAAVVAVAGGADGADPARLGDWLAERLAPYKLPRRWATVADLPRNAMGKVTKPEVKRLFA